MKKVRRSTRRVIVARFLSIAVLVPAFGARAQPGFDPDGPDRTYYVYVAAESEDRVDLVRFGPAGAEVVESIPVGVYPTEIDGPHGVAVSPDGSRWFVTLAHGNPFGRLVAYNTADNRRVGQALLGLFPASMQVSGTGLIFAVNFNLHGDHVPSGISVVDVPSMTEIGRVTTCTMPHGSRLTRDGTRHYSVCMMGEQLVELDAHRLTVARRLLLEPGRERALSAEATEAPATAPAPATRCSPTWAQPSPDGARVYVACNKTAEVLEIDVERWKVRRRFETGAGPYNLDVTPDGLLLVVTYKGARATGVWRLSDGRELAAVENRRTLPHGVAISPDSRYAFVSVEGVGGEPGAVDVIDLATGRVAASVDVGKQAGGIAFWKMEDPS